MKSGRLLRLLALASMLLGSCSVFNPQPAPAAVEITASPTAESTRAPVSILSPTATATATMSPRTEETPAVVIHESDPLPTPTEIVLPRALPDAYTKILQPATGSFVTSPFRVIGRGGPTWMNRVVLDLVGEDGRLVSRTITYLNAYPGNAGPFAAEVSFDIDSMSELARLEVYTHSRRDGQVYQMASVQLILLEEGRKLIHAALDGPEKLAVFSPRPDDVIEGGTVLVSGAGWVDHDVPLTVEIRDRLGDPIASTSADLISHGPGQTGIFSVEVPYSVEVSQPGRIVVYEPAVDIPGIVHLTGIDVWIKP